MPSQVTTKWRWVLISVVICSCVAFYLFRCLGDDTREITLQASVKSTKSDGTVEAFEIRLRNERLHSVKAVINPKYFDGIILILKRDDSVLGVRHSTRYKAIRSGPMPMAEITLKPDQIYSWEIHANDFSDSDGGNVLIHANEIKTILAVSETVWFGKDDQERDQLLIRITR